MTSLPVTQVEALFAACASDLDALHEKSASAAPNYKVTREEFMAVLKAAVEKYLISRSANTTTATDVLQLISELQITDLFMAVACAKGDERAWWDF
ncbi:MAG: hypothetical protein WKF84_20210 [Pyrinomonadaceae bacterium]